MAVLTLESRTPFLVQILNKYPTMKDLANRFGCDFLWFCRRQHASIQQGLYRKIRKKGKFILSRRFLKRKSNFAWWITPQDSQAWKMSQFLCTLRFSYRILASRSFLLCVILLLHPCWFKVLLKQSHACQTAGQTRCSNLVSGICKGKYMYRYFQNVSVKKYRCLFIQLPWHDTKLLFVECW